MDEKTSCLSLNFVYQSLWKASGRIINHVASWCVRSQAGGSIRLSACEHVERPTGDGWARVMTTPPTLPLVNCCTNALDWFCSFDASGKSRGMTFWFSMECVEAPFVTVFFKLRWSVWICWPNLLQLRCGYSSIFTRAIQKSRERCAATFRIFGSTLIYQTEFSWLDGTRKELDFLKKNKSFVRE